MKVNEKVLEVSEIVVRATSGTVVGAAIREAICLALAENQVVILLHNDKSYNIDPNEVVRFAASERGQ